MKISRYLFKTLLIGLLMLAAAGGSYALTPRALMSEQKGPIDLEALIPKAFGTWKIDNSIVPISVSPEVQAKLDQLYSQVLARTYINARGERIMLSIAYGSDQSGETTQVHRPEYCYAAQGFQVKRTFEGTLQSTAGVLPVRRLIASSGSRIEPITYWITVGETVTLPGIGRKLKQLEYGIAGVVPDGMLVRISSIDAKMERAYALQLEFINEMLASVEEAGRVRIAGRTPR